MRRFVLLVLCLLALPGMALASSHEVTKVKAIKEHGKVVGAEIHVLLKPAGHFAPVVGIGRPGKHENRHAPEPYMFARDKKLGYLIDTLGEVATRGPTEHVFQLRFDRKNRLQPGDKVEIFSLWRSISSAHLWGARRSPAYDGPVYTLPTR